MFRNFITKLDKKIAKIGLFFRKSRIENFFSTVKEKKNLIKLAFHTYRQNLREIPSSSEDESSDINDHFNIINPFRKVLKMSDTDAGALEILLNKFSQLEAGQNSLLRSIQLLNEENTKRADEIKILARKSDALLTEDESASGGRQTASSHTDDQYKNII